MLDAIFKQKRVRYAAIALAVLLLVYIVVGFWVAPAVVQSVLPKMLKERFDLTAQVEDLRLNPFTFSATVQGFAVGQGQDAPFFEFDRLDARPEGATPQSAKGDCGPWTSRV